MKETDNELIEDFMSLNRTPINTSENYAISAGIFRYDQSWDLLMQVLNKIEKLGCIVELSICLGSQCRIVWVGGRKDKAIDFINSNGDDLITSCYLTIVQFIKWYNTNTNKF